MKFDLKINISTEGLIENYKKLDEINLFCNHYNNYYFYLNAVTLLEENKLCNDIKHLHISIVYLYLKILEIMYCMCGKIIYDYSYEETVYLNKKLYLDTLKKTKIEVSDNKTVFHLEMTGELEFYDKFGIGILKSYMVEELVKRAIIAMCLDSSFVSSELREFLLYNITFELRECEEETNEHEEEENNADNQTANLEPTPINPYQVAKRTSLIIEAPNSKIKKILDWLIFCTERGHNFQDEYATVDVVLNEDIHKKEKIITAFFTFKPDDLSLFKIDKFVEILRETQELFAISLLNIMRTDKRLKKYGVRVGKEARARGGK